MFARVAKIKISLSGIKVQEKGLPDCISEEADYFFNHLVIIAASKVMHQDQYAQIVLRRLSGEARVADD